MDETTRNEGQGRKRRKGQEEEEAEPNKEIRQQIDKKIHDDNLAWRILDKYFTDNPNNLVSHHLE
jgi:hypothetical protein